MSVEELTFKVDQLTFQLEEQNKRHTEAVAQLKEEASQLQKSLRVCLERGRGKVADDSPCPADDAFIRRIEWRIEDFSNRVKDVPNNEAIWSSEFTVLGVSGMRLEFFPKGRESTKLPGFCALFLWCPPGVRIKYRLGVGQHWSNPDEDEFDSKMGHGHSNFCSLEAQIDKNLDSLAIGLEILSMYHEQEAVPGVKLKLMNAGPEALVERETARLRNSHMDTVEWRIKNIRKRAREVPRGLAISSPLFSIAGVREMLLEFYPNGITPPPGAKEGREGYCGFYMRAHGGEAAGALVNLQLTLFVGGARKGPIRTDFEGGTAKGLPEFCRLEEQLQEDEDDLVVGVTVVNPLLHREDQVLQLS